MTLDDVARYGAKGAVLDYIRRTDSSIPIEPFVLVPVGEDWRIHEAEITKLGDSLVRSSSPVEDGQRLSFAGLFDTVEFRDENSVKQVLESTQSEDALTYARIHGVTIPSEMGLVFHKDSGAKWNWGILRHPHRSNILFIQGRPVPDYHRISENFILDEKTGLVQDTMDYAHQIIYGQKKRPKELPEGVPEAIEAYHKIEQLPEFKTGHTYHMEFGTEPFSVYQFRPFRKIEKANWKLNVKACDSDDENLNKYGIAFGITPQQGIELTVARALSGHEQEKHIKRFRKYQEAGKTKEEIARSLLRGWKLSKLERPYAEEIADVPADTFGSVESDAFDNALRRINATASKERTCIAQQSMHFYYGKDIDLVFPNAKAWVAHMGFEFLSHNWFRAAQTYDVTLIGGNIYGKTGQSVRIYSDGLVGLAVERFS